MISAAAQSIDDGLSLAGSALLLLTKIWALWLFLVPLYVLIDAFVRAGLLRGWFGGSGEAILRAIAGDAATSRAIEAEQLGAADTKAPQRKELPSVLILGEGPASRALLAHHVANWRGGVIAIGAHDLSERIAVQDAVRFCPGERRALSLNPMLMLQGGPYAWREARILAAGLIGRDGNAAEILAAFMLDQLLTAPLHERHLAALRRRLFEPEARALGQLELRSAEGLTAHLEIARVGRRLAAQNEETAKAFGEIAQALRPWADGRVEEATRDLDAYLSDVACADLNAITIEAPPGDEALCHGLFAALAGQAILQLTDAAKSDNQGRIRLRPVLLVLEDAALTPCIPQLRRRMRDLGACGVSVALMARTVADATLALGIAPSAAGAILHEFDAMAVAGPQDTDTAEVLSAYAGAARRPCLTPLFAASGIWKYSGWLFPCLSWPEAPHLEADSPERLKAQQVLFNGTALRMLNFGPSKAKSNWRSKPLPALQHAWMAPPVLRPKTTMQRLRDPIPSIATQKELPLQVLPKTVEVQPPFSLPPASKRRPRRKNI